MSLDHILDTARKLGIPVIITNDRGQSPQVIMPFEDFASMVGVSTPPGKRTRVSKAEDNDEEDQKIAQALADMTRETMEYEISKEPEEESERSIQKESNENTEAFMEEKFYFEPLEDEQEKK
jgi:hypothetical protein